MIGGPVIAYIHYFNMLAYEALHWSFLNTAAFKMPFYLILTAVITLIPFYLSDKYLPALNGSLTRTPTGEAPGMFSSRKNS